MTTVSRTVTHEAPRHASRRRGRRSSLAGTGTLVRFLLRRDRVRLPAWVAGLGVFVVYIGVALPTIAPTEKDLASMAPLLAQPVGRMFTGPAFGMEAPTYGRFFAAGYAPYLYLLAALMSILLVSRHTRLEEETGRAELVRANVTGPHALLTAALLVALVTNALAGVVVALLAIAGGFAVGGSVLVGAATGLTGMAFAGVAAVTVQLSAFSRAATGLAGAVLGAAFVVRALGDMIAVGGSALSWASPLGWATQTAPYVHDRWAPLALLVLTAVVSSAAGFALQDRRDFGSSLVATRPGRPEARPSLGTPAGLAARLQRGALLGWGGGIIALGVVDGAFTQAVVDAGEDMPPALQDVFTGADLTRGYAAFLGSFVTVVVAAYAVFALQSLQTEERSGRTDAVLATPLGRTSWLGAHAGTVALGVVAISAVTGLLTGVAAALPTGRWDLVGQVLLAHVALLPAPLLVVGLAVALHGWAPRLMTPVCWALVVWMAVVDFFGTLLDLPGALMKVSPLEHLAGPPVEDVALAPLAVVTLVAVGLLLLGLLGYRRRQIGAV